MSESPRRPTIALAGGGHANLYTLRRTGELVSRGFEVVLIDPSEHLYFSGMATGVLSGSYKPGENRIDIRDLVVRGGGRFVKGRVGEILYGDRALVLDDGRVVPYDAASFCPGSEARAWNGAIPAKPVFNLEKVRGGLLAPGTDARRVLVVGGGAAGCEVAANIAGLLRDAGLGGR